MSGDSRFAKVFNDPRFMVAPNKVTKVKIDKRFETMFKNKEFNVVAKVDKYGRKINKQDKHALQNYYTSKDDKQSGSGSGSDSESSDQEDLDKARDEIKKKIKAAREPVEEDSDAKEGKKFYDETGKFHWSGDSSGSSEGEGEEDQ